MICGLYEAKRDEELFFIFRLESVNDELVNQPFTVHILQRSRNIKLVNRAVLLVLMLPEGKGIIIRSVRYFPFERSCGIIIQKTFYYEYRLVGAVGLFLIIEEVQLCLRAKI